MYLKIGTRGSKLALTQTKMVSEKLTELGAVTEIVVIKTHGDVASTVPLHEIGGQGVFVRPLDDAILQGEIDAAIHSMKDIPAKRPEGISTCAILKRDSPADFLIHDGEIGSVTTIGTSSMRRRSQLLRYNPAIVVKPLRGNLDTRLRHLTAGNFDAIVVAEAGLQRLGIPVKGEQLPLTQFVPTANQGTVAAVCRSDPVLMELFQPLNHPQTRTDIAFERAVIEEIGGGCYTPLGVYCRNGHLIAEVLSLDGCRWKRIERNVKDVVGAHECGKELKEQARDLIGEVHEQLGGVG